MTEYKRRLSWRLKGDWVWVKKVYPVRVEREYLTINWVVDWVKTANF